MPSGPVPKARAKIARSAWSRLKRTAPDDGSLIRSDQPTNVADQANPLKV
jgi:hypothetical protein